MHIIEDRILDIVEIVIASLMLVGIGWLIKLGFNIL